MNSFLKLTLITINILLITTISFCQKSQLLVKGGIHHYSLNGKNILPRDTAIYSEGSGKTGFQFGYNYEYSFAKRQSLLVGLEFSRRKFVDSISVFTAPVFFYIGTPVSYNFEVVRNLKAKIGFQFDYLLKKYQFNYGVNLLEPELSGRFLNYDLGLSYGLRYQIWNLDLEINGVYGLVDILQKKTSESYARSRYLSLSCSYVID